ncbi:heteromeric transposase endonuclease subunit TnsA [Bacillus sp. V3-13]|uniref:TnsA endonuclease N-terminal domain-containing protein n=1 Tax=Bacillus sp. V3-13 TaxID=2053728 RepID=UPI000C77CB1E|nr:TnsA endonuclease N-terminal domain-containing protein [Bacillus sp. V3-13]PLR76759.1 heteromeric transposase endonuclease subunit TnsA [Bacillus sp. V3-13]
MSRNRYTWTEEKIAKYYKEGRGSGDLANYRPWLTIQDVPSEGRAHRPRGWKTTRKHDLLSDLELSFFFYLEWSNKVIDIKEQYPLDRQDTMEIAAEKHIPHPFEKSTQTPIVMTTDFLVTIRTGKDINIIARSIKPSEKLEDPDVLGKLEIERQFWEDKGIQWTIVDEKVMPKQFFKNMRYIHEYFYLPDKKEEETAKYFLSFLDSRQPKYPEKMLIDCCNEFDSLYNLDDGSSIYYLRHLYARQYILPNDMNNKPIVPHGISLNELNLRSGGSKGSYGNSIS